MSQTSMEEAMVAKARLKRLLDSQVVGIGIMHYHGSGWKLEVRTVDPIDPPLPQVEFDGVEVNVVPVGKVEAL